MKRVYTLLAVLLLFVLAVAPADAAGKSRVVKCNGHSASVPSQGVAYPGMTADINWVYPVSKGGGTKISVNIDASNMPVGTYVASLDRHMGGATTHYQSPPITVGPSGDLEWSFGLKGEGPWLVEVAITPVAAIPPVSEPEAVAFWLGTIGRDSPCDWDPVPLG